MVQALLDAGADPRVKDNVSHHHGCTPYELAEKTRSGQKEAVLELLTKAMTHAPRQAAP